MLETRDATATPAHLSRTLRVVNVGTASVALASSLAVLGSWIADPGYREHYHDAPWFVATYAAFHVWVVYAFVTARLRLAQALTVARTVAAYVFLLTFPMIGLTWMVWTPGRYVYQLFDWGPEARITLMAFVFLGRGAWNTVNAFAVTRDVWFPLRTTRPLVGRLITIIPVAGTVGCVWMFLALARMNATEFSPEAHEVAIIVADAITCDDLRPKVGTTTSDVRQRGDRRYDVSIAWDCADLRVIVHAEDGRIGTVRTSRPECCGTEG
jgi:hypothetical protein